MITVPELAANALDTFLASHMKHRFGSIQAGLIERTSSAARVALKCIGNSDALYHNVEHTMLVTLVGYDIMNGRALLKHTSASDYAHVIVACLFHDIGYVRGILKGDEPGGYMVYETEERLNYRAARPMPPCCLITLIAQSSTCWIASLGTISSTPTELRVPSNSRAFLCPPGRRLYETKKGCWCVPPTL